MVGRAAPETACNYGELKGGAPAQADLESRPKMGNQVPLIFGDMHVVYLDLSSNSST